jgi:hypothetical protein
MRFHAFWPLSQTRLFLNSRGLGVGGEEMMQRHSCESEFWRKEWGGKVDVEYVEKGRE